MRVLVGQPRTWTDEQLREAVASCFSYAAVLRKLGLVPRGGNYLTLKRALAQGDHDTSHFTGKGWRKGSPKPVRVARSLEEILVESSSYLGTAHLRQRLLDAGLKYTDTYRGKNQGRTDALRLIAEEEFAHYSSVSALALPAYRRRRAA